MLIYPMSLFGMLALIMPADGLVSPKNVGLLLVFICPLMGDMLAYYIGSSIRRLREAMEAFLAACWAALYASCCNLYGGCACQYFPCCS